MTIAKDFGPPPSDPLIDLQHKPLAIAPLESSPRLFHFAVRRRRASDLRSA